MSDGSAGTVEPSAVLYGKMARRRRRRVDEPADSATQVTGRAQSIDLGALDRQRDLLELSDSAPELLVRLLASVADQVAREDRTSYEVEFDVAELREAYDWLLKERDRVNPLFIPETEAIDGMINLCEYWLDVAEGQRQAGV